MKNNNKDRFEIAEEIFQNNNGILRTSQALEYGISPPTLYEMREKGIIVQESIGIYRLASLPPLSYPDIVTVALKVPKAIICTVSALSYYGITTKIPDKVYFALPRGTKKPKIKYPPISVFHLSEKSYKVGIDTISLDGKSVRIYSPEKTIADCFKFRGRIGENLAIEALKDYLRQPNSNINLLVEYASKDRVKSVMTPFIKGELI